MDENNTTPPPNVPDDNEKDKSKDSFFGKKRDYFQENYKKIKTHEEYEKEYDWHHKPEPLPPTPSAYEEIVDDLIDIIAKLLKELSKRK